MANTADGALISAGCVGLVLLMSAYGATWPENRKFELVSTGYLVQEKGIVLYFCKLLLTNFLNDEFKFTFLLNFSILYYNANSSSSSSDVLVRTVIVINIINI